MTSRSDCRPHRPGGPRVSQSWRCCRRPARSTCRQGYRRASGGPTVKALVAPAAHRRRGRPRARDRLHAKAIAPPIGAPMMGFTEKRSPDAAGAHYRDVAVALVSSGEVATIALEECNRRAAGLGPQNRAVRLARIEQAPAPPSAEKQGHGLILSQAPTLINDPGLRIWRDPGRRSPGRPVLLLLFRRYPRLTRAAASPILFRATSGWPRAASAARETGSPRSGCRCGSSS